MRTTRHRHNNFLSRLWPAGRFPARKRRDSKIVCIQHGYDYAGNRYIDDLVCHDRDINNDGTLDERLYNLTDLNWNLVALTDTSGTVQERYANAAFGTPNIFTGDFATTRTTSAHAWTRTFTGQVCDIETSIMLYRNRYHHPYLGRYKYMVSKHSVYMILVCCNFLLSYTTWGVAKKVQVDIIQN